MAEQNQDQLENETKLGRPAILDERKRRQVVAILANGSSRRVAAHVVGCSHSTIVRTAQRDPQFAADIEAAEYGVEVRALRQINAAADKDRYWRAAAWLLERRNPRDFAPKTPDTITPEAVSTIFLQVTRSLMGKLSDEEVDDFLDELYKLECALHESDNLHHYLSSPPPSKPDYVARDKEPPKNEPFAPPLDWEDDDPDFDPGTDPFTRQ